MSHSLDLGDSLLSVDDRFLDGNSEDNRSRTAPQVSAPNQSATNVAAPLLGNPEASSGRSSPTSALNGSHHNLEPAAHDAGASRPHEGHSGWPGGFVGGSSGDASDIGSSRGTSDFSATSALGRNLAAHRQSYHPRPPRPVPRQVPASNKAHVHAQQPEPEARRQVAEFARRPSPFMASPVDHFANRSSRRVPVPSDCMTPPSPPNEMRPTSTVSAGELASQGRSASPRANYIRSSSLQHQVKQSPYHGPRLTGSFHMSRREAPRVQYPDDRSSTTSDSGTGEGKQGPYGSGEEAGSSVSSSLELPVYTTYPDVIPSFRDHHRFTTNTSDVKVAVCVTVFNEDELEVSVGTPLCACCVMHA